MMCLSLVGNVADTNIVAMFQGIHAKVANTNVQNVGADYD